MDLLPAVVFAVLVGVAVLHYLWKGQVHPGWKAVLVAVYLWGLYDLVGRGELYQAWRTFILVGLVVAMLWAYDKMST